jgi:predicted AAA+ superfamily ATPase
MFIRALSKKFIALTKTFSVVAVTGPRQSGKTTLVRELLPDYRYVSLEDLDTRAYAQKDPRGFLSEYDKRVIIDEVQLVPDLFSYLQGVVDQNQLMGQYILTGSQHFLLHEKISQSLAGRSAFLHLLPLSLAELIHAKVVVHSPEETLFRGFYPRLYTSKVEIADWYSNYIRTYVERDLRMIKNIQDLGAFQTFIKLCASRTGQILDLTSIGNDCGVSHNTISGWIGILEASFIIFLLRPYYQNFGKRLIKSPKIYFYDTGLLCHLLNIGSADQLTTHYLRGGIFESYVLSEMLKYQYNQGLDPSLYFWRDQQGKEIDCIAEAGSRLIACEIKSSKTISSDFFAHLEYWQKISNTNPQDSYLIYGGKTSQKRSQATVLAWDAVTNVMSSLQL